MAAIDGNNAIKLLHAMPVCQHPSHPPRLRVMNSSKRFL
jgi:hypothetical protein